MNKRQVLVNLLSGEIPPAQAATEVRGLTFWAFEEAPDLFSVEIRRHAQLIEQKNMTAAQLDHFKPKCAHWIVIASSDANEWIHSGNRNLYPYE